jgi:hypothetical protein
MASMLEPPAVISVGVTVAAAAGAVWYGLRRSGALSGPLPHVVAEDEEEWGTEPPPPPSKRPYVYPSDRPRPVPADESEAAEPRPAGTADHAPVAVTRVAPPVEAAVDIAPPPPAVQPPTAVQSAVAESPAVQAARATDVSDEPDSGRDDEEEISLADLFARRRRPRTGRE